MKPAPYPSDTRAKGWRFELDYERIDQSDTWALAGEVPMAQPALLMMWLAAWTQEPCGSLPNDENLIRAKCRIPADVWPGLRDVLMRGWWLADDGRLYHDTITRRVLELLEYRRKNAKRVADFKARHAEQQGANALAPRDPPVSNDTGTGTSTNKEKATPNGVAPPPATPDGPPTLKVVPKAGYEPPNCPHQEILALWQQILPALPQHLPDRWKGARADHLRARWKEMAVKHRWQSAAEGLEFFSRMFGYIGKSPFLTGRKNAPGKRPFEVELEWIVRDANFSKLLEGKYHTDEAQA